MKVTNVQLLQAIESLDKRLTNVENILMGNPGRNNSRTLSPAITFLIRWVVFPLIVVLGGLAGVKVLLPI